jgi:hypothetical protein
MENHKASIANLQNQIITKPAASSLRAIACAPPTRPKVVFWDPEEKVVRNRDNAMEFSFGRSCRALVFHPVMLPMLLTVSPVACSERSAPPGRRRPQFQLEHRDGHRLAGSNPHLSR